MRDFLGMFFKSSLARDYLVASMVFAILSLFAVQAVTGLIDSTRQNVRVQTARIEPQEPVVRNYQISRSVLDDTVITGSIGSSRPVILDPCTGATKSK